MLANELGMSSTYISQMFPKYFNANFGEYIRKLRIEKAVSLLPHQHLSLSQITYDCGFSDQSHFIRCFKEIYSVTPSQYRKMLPEY